MNRFQGNITDKTFAIWGLSFKPNTNDVREAPSLVIIDKIIRAGGKVKAYDPIAMPETKNIIKDKIEYSMLPVNGLASSTLTSIESPI